MVANQWGKIGRRLSKYSTSKDTIAMVEWVPDHPNPQVKSAGKAEQSSNLIIKRISQSYEESMVISASSNQTKEVVPIIPL